MHWADETSGNASFNAGFLKTGESLVSTVVHGVITWAPHNAIEPRQFAMACLQQSFGHEPPRLSIVRASGIRCL